MGLTELRVQINNVDEHLEELLQQRLGLIYQVAEIKKKENLPIFDPKREQKILSELKQRVNVEYEPYVEKMFKAMFDISRSYQEELMKNK